MSKSGRYSADRKKIEALAADKTVEVSDCGTIFICSAAITLTLPTAAAAGKGWWVRVVKATAASGGAISVTATSTLDGVGVDGNGVGIFLQDDFTLHTDGNQGSLVEIVSDGTQYWAWGVADTANGFSA